MNDESLLPFTEHGGRRQQAATRYGIPLSRWMDLSTGINPHGFPVGTIPQEIFARLPEENDGLDEVLRCYFGTSSVLAVAGSQNAIQALPSLRSPGRVAVHMPTYGEHARAWQNAGHKVLPVDLAHEENAEVASLLDTVDVLVVVNPNNPTGEVFRSEQLLRWHEQLSRHDGWLVVDEAFVDALPGVSIAGHASKNLIILRSLGKFWGLAGIRFGCVLAAHELLSQLKARLGPWHVSNPARWTAQSALADGTWIETTRLRLHQDTARLHALLTSRGLLSHGTCPLFRWVPTQDVAQLFDALARQGILIRALPQFGGVRFGLPGPEHEWTRLEAALKQSLGGSER
jgi:cobalamin biosynthesis protein CobC